MLHKLEVADNGNHIIKYFDDKALLKLEKNRTIEAHNICLDCELLVVPEVITSDDQSITSVYYTGAIRYADLLLNDFDQALTIAPKIAKALVFLQENLHHSKKLNLQAGEWRSTDCQHFVHGDLSVHNLLVQDNSIILVDWTSSFWGGQQFNYAPQHWDIAWLIMGLYLIPHPKELSFTRKDQIAETLLNEYWRHGGFSEQEKLRSFALAQNEHFQRFRKRQVRWYSTVKHYPEWFRCRRFWKTALNERA